MRRHNVLFINIDKMMQPFNHNFVSVAVLEIFILMFHRRLCAEAGRVQEGKEDELITKIPKCNVFALLGGWRAMGLNQIL